MEHVGVAVLDAGVGESPAAPGDRGGRDVECGDAEAGGGKGFGVVAEAAADVEGASAVAAGAG